MPPHSILAVTDFSPIGDRALARAALLCAEHGATLKLLGLVHAGDRHPLDASCRLAHHARQLGQRHDVGVRAVSQIAHAAEEVLPQAQCADLVVWGAAPVPSLRSFFLGQPLEDVLRRCRRPVLVVRRQAERAYGRLLVAVDFSQASRGLIDLGLALNTSADVELFHAIGTANERNLRHAEASGAELIVVGKRPASVLSERMFGSIAGRVLRDADADVLVVPHDYRAASKASAVSRLNAESLIVRRLRAGAPQPPGGPSPAAVLGRT